MLLQNRDRALDFLRRDFHGIEHISDVVVLVAVAVAVPVLGFAHPSSHFNATGLWLLGRANSFRMTSHSRRHEGKCSRSYKSEDEERDQ